MENLETFIQTLVTEYLNDEITWHDIQDDVEVYVLKQDGKGCAPDINVVIDRFFKETEILSEIQRRIDKEVK
jgi:hypothetical protein